MAHVKPNGSKSDPGHVSVSNLPEDADDPVEETAVMEPATTGLKPGPVPVGDEELEIVKGRRRAASHAAQPESVAAPARVAKLWTPPATHLPDIGEASFGPPPPRPETVHGPDNRKRVSDTASYPWSAIASLLITARDNSTWIGTGWFISPRTLITAGHCVYIKDSGVPGRDGWVKKINVMAGRDGDSLPYGSVTSTVFKSVPGWTQDGNETYDYAAIILPTPLGNTVGVFGIGVFPNAELESLEKVMISGYPGDKKDKETGTQWYDARRLAQVNSRKVYYDIDTEGGQSGAPVFRVLNGKRIGIAVHAYGGNATNSGTRINREVYKNLVSWMA